MSPEARDEDVKKTFQCYAPGQNVPSDGNCGLYALHEALNDGLDVEATTMKDILDFLGLDSFPKYWLSDDELALIAHNFGHDTYVYNESDNTGIAFIEGDVPRRPPVVLYSVNNNSHWTPGTRTVGPSKWVPDPFTVIGNVQQVLTAEEIRKRIADHVLAMGGGSFPADEDVYGDVDCSDPVYDWRLSKGGPPGSPSGSPERAGGAYVGRKRVRDERNRMSRKTEILMRMDEWLLSQLDGDGDGDEDGDGDLGGARKRIRGDRDEIDDLCTLMNQFTTDNTPPAPRANQFFHLRAFIKSKWKTSVGKSGGRAPS